MDENKAIEAIQRAMLQQSVSQARLAEELSHHLGRPYDRSMVNKMLLGKRNISAVEMAAISKILKNRLLAEMTDGTVDLLLGHVDLATPGAEDTGALIPVYDVAASAGNGFVNEYEPQASSLAFPPDFLRRLTSSSPRNLAIISVKGDSMEPTLLDDDIVLLDTSKTNLSYDGLFVLRFDEALHVKRVGRAAKKGFITIISDNQNFPPITAEREDVEAVGKVLWYGRKV